MGEIFDDRGVDDDGDGNSGQWFQMGVRRVRGIVLWVGMVVWVGVKGCLDGWAQEMLDELKERGGNMIAAINQASSEAYYLGNNSIALNEGISLV